MNILIPLAVALPVVIHMGAQGVHSMELLSTYVPTFVLTCVTALGHVVLTLLSCYPPFCTAVLVPMLINCVLALLTGTYTPHPDIHTPSPSPVPTPAEEFNTTDI